MTAGVRTAGDASNTPGGTRQRTAYPPRVGSIAGAKTDQMLHDDLAVMLEMTGSTSAAIRWSVALAAYICRMAWDDGDYPRGTIPRIASIEIRPYEGENRD